MASPGRFLFVTWAGGGNVHPLVALGSQLLARGHHVRAISASSLADRFEAEGIGFRAHRPGVEWTGGLAEDVIAEAGRAPTDVVVVDFMQPHALCGAATTGVAVVAYVHTLYARFSVGAPSPMEMAADVDSVNTVRAELGLAPVGQLVDLLDEAARVLVITTPELDGADGTAAANVSYVGPLVEAPGPDAGWTPPGSPLVVVSLGTTPMDEGPVLQRVLDALAEVPVEVFATVGDHLDPATIRVPGHATISRPVRHAAVLPHARLLVTHAGLSSIGAALTFGVPMLCLPLGRDQPVNAAAVSDIGAGRTLPPDATVDEIRGAVASLLEDEAPLAVARRLAAGIRGSAAVEALEHLLVS